MTVVIFKEFGRLKNTIKENFDARIRNESLVMTWTNSKST